MTRNVWTGSSVHSWVPKAERGNTTREDRETETQGQEEEARVVLKVPYVKGASEKLKKSLKKAAGVDVVFSGGVSIKQKLCAKNSNQQKTRWRSRARST